MKKKILITRDFNYSKLNELSEIYDIEVNDLGRDYTYEELNRKIKDKDAVITMLSNKIDKQLIKNNPNVKVFCNYAAGYNNIDVEFAKINKRYVTNTPGVLNDVTSELALALLFSVARRVVEADRYTRNNKFQGWEPLLFLGKDISHRTIGIIGAGNIGQSLGKKAKAFNMKILYWNRSRKFEFEDETDAKYVPLEDLLRLSDFVSVHLPSTPQTYHFINEDSFNMMKSGAIFINTSRGNIVDEQALVDALEKEKIWGAGLDVYENEPNISKDLLKLDNVVLLPHLGGATQKTRENMGDIVFENIQQAFNNIKPFSNLW